MQTCTACYNLQLKCEYEMPPWWKKPELRKKHKDSIKQSIRTTKPTNGAKPKATPVYPLMAQTPMLPPSKISSPPSLSHSMPTTGSLSEPFPYPPDRSSFDPSTFSSPPFQVDTPQTFFDSTPMMPAAQWTPLPPQYPAFPTPQWELDIKTERQTYVNGYPSSKESTTSTFGTWEPVTPTMMLPSYPPQAWTKQDSFEVQTDNFNEDEFDPTFFHFENRPISPEHQVVIQVEDCDRPLLNHFLDNVTPFIFSVFDARQKGSSIGDVVLPQLENNPIYLHCCLSTAALHLKVTENIEGDEIDTDIIRHRHSTITSLCEAFANESHEPSRLLEATLAMILFQSSVGSSEDGLPDIPWHSHFEAVVNLIEKIHDQQSPSPDQPYPHPKPEGHHAAFNLTLAYWIDILGATALRRVPSFSDSYRAKIESSEPSGLAELMGCDDRVMYLISEIACLDSLRASDEMDEMALCTHIANLGDRLGQTEFGPAELAPAHTPGTGAIRPRQLSRNITAVFRFAARIYLCSLVPDFDRHAESIMQLVNQITDAMVYVPSGAEGFDRALVWPLLVAGSVSVPASRFRDMLAQRATEMGQASEFGSFGRARELLREVWRINDEYTSKGERTGVTWRDVMEKKGVDFLII